MRNLKDLTRKELVEIANLFDFNLIWNIEESKHKWNGFDIVSSCRNHILQISLDAEVESPITYWLNDQHINKCEIPQKTLQKIFNYLHEIGVTLDSSPTSLEEYTFNEDIELTLAEIVNCEKHNFRTLLIKKAREFKLIKPRTDILDIHYEIAYLKGALIGINVIGKLFNY